MSKRTTDDTPGQVEQTQEDPGAELQSMSVKVPTDTWRRARIYSLDTGKTLSEIVADALSSHLTAQEARRR